MADSTPYVLDANVFIEAYHRYYSFELAPGFWRLLVESHRAGRVRSIDRVQLELAKGKDALAEWARDHEYIFASTDDDATIAAYSEVMEWVEGQDQFRDAAKASFASGADGWLIAFARAHGYTVVTHEQESAASRKRVPMPNVCQAVGAAWTDPFAMLRAIGLRLG